MTQDEEHVRMLSIFHYVVSGLAALFALFPLFHLVLGLIFIFAPGRVAGRGDAPPAFLGWFFVGFAVVFITLGWVFAVLVLTAGRSLAKRKRYTFCLVVAGLECLFMPFGTVLGIFTIVVLMRPQVKELFMAGTWAGPPPLTGAAGG
jgi:hypothetical protein